MTLRRIETFEFVCDSCGNVERTSAGFYGGRPYDWTGPTREDGFHLCNECRLKKEVASDILRSVTDERGDKA